MSQESKTDRKDICLEPHPLPCLSYAPVFRGEVDACENCAPYVDQMRQYVPHRSLVSFKVVKGEAKK